MNKPRRIEEILKRLGGEEIPGNVEETAGRVVEDFRRELEQEGGHTNIGKGRYCWCRCVGLVGLQPRLLCFSPSSLEWE